MLEQLKKSYTESTFPGTQTAEVYIFITLFSGWFTRNLLSEFTRLFAKIKANERI